MNTKQEAIELAGGDEKWAQLGEGGRVEVLRQVIESRTTLRRGSADPDEEGHDWGFGRTGGDQSTLGGGWNAADCVD